MKVNELTSDSVGLTWRSAPTNSADPDKSEQGLLYST